MTRSSLRSCPKLFGQVRRLNDSISEGRYTELLELLGLDDAEKSQDEEVRTVGAGAAG